VIGVTRYLIRVCAAAGVAAFALSGCGGGSAKKSTGTGTGTGAFGAGQGSASTGTGMLGTGATPSAGSGSTGGGGQQQSGPQIVFFKVTQQPQCEAIGTTDAPYKQPAIPVRLSWKVTGAAGVALSVDDPGSYKRTHYGSFGSYGAEGTVEINFTCQASSGRTTKHTYTIDTLGDNSKEKTISVTATNP
jgi:hypothetical protein